MMRRPHYCNTEFDLNWLDRRNNHDENAHGYSAFLSFIGILKKASNQKWLYLCTEYRRAGLLN